MSRPTGGTRSSSAPPRPRVEDDSSPFTNRFKTDETIKKKHADKREQRRGVKDEVPSYMRPTVTSLFKRQSFRYGGERSGGKLDRRRYHSVDVTAGRQLEEFAHQAQHLDLDRGYQSIDIDSRLQLEDLHESQNEEEMDSMINCSSSESGSLQDFVLDSGQDDNLDLSSMCDDVERAYKGTFDERRLRRNSTGTSQRVEGGLSPLPPRSSDQFSDDGAFLEMRPHSAADLGFFRTMQVPGRNACSNEHREEQKSGVHSLDVELTDEQLRHGDSRDSRDSPNANPPFMHSESFDSTAAITDSPRARSARSLSPYLSEKKKGSAHWSKTGSNLDLTLPQNLQEIQDSSTEAETSDGSRVSAEVRCQPGAVISGSPPSEGFVQIIEEKRREGRRPSDVNDKPNIKTTLILAGIFTGVAVILGKIFVSRD